MWRYDMNDGMSVTMGNIQWQTSNIGGRTLGKAFRSVIMAVWEQGDTGGNVLVWHIFIDTILP
jgi:hypothetical protein